MCGIAGVLYRDRERLVDSSTLRAMATAIAHRGPDDEGFFTAPGIGLAHRRLSIIDVDGSRQPVGNEGGSVKVVFNGEIYNYAALRRELAERGHRFRTTGDTEVLVHLYEEQGERLVEKLRGMFAFAIWDATRKRLVLARDRVGIKPLFVYRDAEKVVFGSELKAILAHGNVDRRVDPTSIEHYLAFGVISGERCVFQNAFKLRPAHVLTLSGDSLDAKPRRYWRYQPAVDERLTADDWLEAVDAKIAETVAAHRIADVPVGAFLSGGLDSSAMVAVQSEYGHAELKTFSIGFQETEFDELPFAREVAEYFGTEHRDEVVSADAVASVDQLVHHYDEPFADSSALPTMWLSRMTAKHVKVAISGDGGDEAFGGYARYAHDLREAALRRVMPRWWRRSVVAAAASIWPKADWLPRALRLKTLLENLALETGEAYANTISIARPQMRARLLSQEFNRCSSEAVEQAIIDSFRRAPARDPLAGMLTADVDMLLPDDFLTKVDRASMAFGLEVRPPFVDHELLEVAACIPSRFKVRGRETKWMLKRLFADRLPAGIAGRRKRGFEIPVDRWLRGPLQSMCRDTLLRPGASIAALINQQTVEQLLDAHRRGRGRHGAVLWSLLILARWLDAYRPNV